MQAIVAIIARARTACMHFRLAQRDPPSDSTRCACSFLPNRRIRNDRGEMSFGGFMIPAYDGRRVLARRSSNANRFMKQSTVRCGACNLSQISLAYHLTSRCHESNARSFWSLVENACAGHSRRFAERAGDRRKYFLRATRTVQRPERHTNSKCSLLPKCGYQEDSLFLSLSPSFLRDIDLFICPSCTGGPAVGERPTKIPAACRSIHIDERRTLFK